VRDDAEQVAPAGREDWRAWLVEHHEQPDGIWLVYTKKKAAGPGDLTYDEAVEEALCFGWIDSKVQTLDAERFRQWFSPRRPGSIWSALNKQRVDKVVAEGRMTPAGQAKVDAARADGSWSQYDDVDAGIVPGDLREAFERHPGAIEGFDGLTPSARKQVLFWVSSAKRAATREQRIERAAEAAARGEMPGA
jgi:uncharacterized protein YdeI (YjbR/CyaY-like superfamily)